MPEEQSEYPRLHPEVSEGFEEMLPMTDLVAANLMEEVRVRTAGRTPDEVGNIVVHYHLEGDEQYDYMALTWRTPASWDEHWERPELLGKVEVSPIDAPEGSMMAVRYDFLQGPDGLRLERYTQDPGEEAREALAADDMEKVSELRQHADDARQQEREFGLMEVGEKDAQRLLGLLKVARNEARL